MKKTSKIGFGGGCHWCTEAVFQSIKGVFDVKQGWISSVEPYDAFSEAVIVEFNPKLIALHDLIDIHLNTHSCTSDHSFRNKYRSAIYTFGALQSSLALKSIERLERDFEQPILTQVLDFVGFKENKEEFQNYYYTDPDKPFCQRYIGPKISLLKKKFEGLTVSN